MTFHARHQAETLLDAFNFHRQTQSQRARTLGMLLIPLDATYTIPLRRAPEVAQACADRVKSLASSGADPLAGTEEAVSA